MPLLARDLPFEIDLSRQVPINGGFNNLSTWEAAKLVSVVQPTLAIPCHYDMFPDNSVNPSHFRAALKVQSPDTAYQELTHGAPFVFSRE